jgi:hypothetical protein
MDSKVSLTFSLLSTLPFISTKTFHAENLSNTLTIHPSDLAALSFSYTYQNRTFLKATQ